MENEIVEARPHCLHFASAKTISCLKGKPLRNPEIKQTTNDKQREKGKVN